MNRYFFSFLSQIVKWLVYLMLMIPIISIARPNIPKRYLFTELSTGPALTTKTRAPKDAQTLGYNSDQWQLSDANKNGAAFDSRINLGMGFLLHDDWFLELQAGFDFLGQLHLSTFSMEQTTGQNQWNGVLRVRRSMSIPILFGVVFHSDNQPFFGGVYGGLVYNWQSFLVQEIGDDQILKNNDKKRQLNLSSWQPAIQAVAGYQVNDNWAVYARYLQTFNQKFHAVSVNDVSELQQPITYGAFGIGIRYSFAM